MDWIVKARWIAKEYPENIAELRRIEEYQHPALGGTGGRMIKSGNIPRPTEDAAERAAMNARYQYLSWTVKAVNSAMEDVLQKPNGHTTIRLVNMLHFYKTHTLSGAALELHISERTARRYNRYFLRRVAELVGVVKMAGPTLPPGLLDSRLLC